MSPAVTFPLTEEPSSQYYHKNRTSKMLSLFIASDISTTSSFSRRKTCDNLGLCLRQRGCSDRLSLGRAVACKATERGLQFLRIRKRCFKRNPSPSSLRDATSPRGEAHSQSSPTNSNFQFSLIIFDFSTLRKQKNLRALHLHKELTHSSLF